MALQAVCSIGYFWLDLWDVLDDNSLFKHLFIFLLYCVSGWIEFGVVRTHIASVLAFWSSPPLLILQSVFVLCATCCLFCHQFASHGTRISLALHPKRTRPAISGTVFSSKCSCWRYEHKTSFTSCLLAPCLSSQAHHLPSSTSYLKARCATWCVWGR